MLTAIFGIDGGAISLFINLLVLFLVVVYLALIYWTYLDAKRRIEDPVLIACATAAAVFPFIGPVVYTILRPPEFLDDREERELELRAAELRLRQLIEQSCPYCEYPVERNYLRCPNCDRRLRNPCRKCTMPLDPKWSICPYCETEVQRQRSDRAEREGGTRRERERERSTRQARAVSGQRSQGASRSSSTSRQSGSRPSTRPSNSQSGDGPDRRESQRTPGSSSKGSRSSERPTGGRVSRPTR